MEQTIYFIVRYIPFWGIPIIFIVIPAGVVYWQQDLRRISLVFFTLALISAFFVAYWVWAGGPERSVIYLQEFLNFVKG